MCVCVWLQWMFRLIAIKMANIETELERKARFVADYVLCFRWTQCIQIGWIRSRKSTTIYKWSAILQQHDNWWNVIGFVGYNLYLTFSKQYDYFYGKESEHTQRLLVLLSTMCRHLFHAFSLSSFVWPKLKKITHVANGMRKYHCCGPVCCSASLKNGCELWIT